MIHRLRQVITIVLCAALVWTTGDAAQAALFVREPASFLTRFPNTLPRVVLRSTDPSYFTQQAIVQQLGSQIRPSPDHLKGSFKVLYVSLFGPRVNAGSALTEPGISFRPWTRWVGLRWIDVFLGVVLLAACLFWPSPHSGSQHVLQACGNAFLILIGMVIRGVFGLDTVIEIEVPVTVGEEVLEPGFEYREPERIRMTVREILYHMLSMLDIRGRLQAGIVLYKKLGGVEMKKITTPKRSPLPKALLTAFELLGKNKADITYEDGVLRISAHVRAPTSPSADGTLNLEAAQPHHYQDVDPDDHIAEFVQLPDGSLDLVELPEPRTISVIQGHNGDGSRMDIHEMVLDSSSAMYDTLDAILGLHGTKKLGDSKAISGLAAFFFAQARKKSAVALAYHTRLVKKGDSRDIRFPSQQLFEDIGNFLFNGIRQQTRNGRLGRKGMRLSQVPVEQLDELKARLLQTLILPSERSHILSANQNLFPTHRLRAPVLQLLRTEHLRGHPIVIASSDEATVRALRARPLWQRLALIDKAVDAYFLNNLYNAWDEASQHVGGTFGIVLETTQGSPDNQETVVYARGQGMSIGFNKDREGKIDAVFGASSRHALNKFRFRYDMSNTGQLVGIDYGIDPATGERRIEMRGRIESDGRELTQAEIEKGIIDRHLNPYMEEPPDMETTDRVGDEMVSIPKVHQKFRASLQNPNSFNSHTLETMITVVDELASGKRQGNLIMLGSEKSLEAGEVLTSGLRVITSDHQLRAINIAPNNVSRAVAAGWTPNIRKQLDIMPDDFLIVKSASGGDTFDTGRATELLTGFVHEMVVFAGLWDIELTDALDQELYAQALPSGRIMNTYGTWSLAEPATLTDSAMMFALAQSWLRVLRVVKQHHPSSVDLEDEDFERLLGPITDEYLLHEAKILGLKTDGKGPVFDKDGKAIREETEEHQQLVKDAKRFAQHTLENLYINFVILPVLYAFALRFSWPIFPSSWAWLWQHAGLAWNWSAVQIGAHDSLIAIGIGVGMHGVGILGAMVWNYVGLILLNIVALLIYPWAITRLYRKWQGRQLGRRRGGVTALIVDPSPAKIANLYAKLQALMFGAHQPIILDSNDISVIHNFSFRVERGGLIIHSRASPTGIDQTDRAATIMVENQAGMVQHLGTGPEIVSFDHLPYETPIRAPYDKFVRDISSELQLNADQILKLNDFLNILPEAIKTFITQNQDALLEDVPHALGVMLELEGDRLDRFEKAFHHYIERQLAFEQLFKVHFADEENWTKHYVFAYTWAKENAHPWILRLLVWLVDSIPSRWRDRLTLKFPQLNFMIDIARTFVGTGRLTTAPPFDASNLAKLRKKYPSILTKRHKKQAAAEPIPTPVFAKSEAPASSSRDEDLKVKFARLGDESNKSAHAVDRTSLIVAKHFIEDDGQRPTSEPINFPSAEDILQNRLQKPAKMTDKAFIGLKEVLKELLTGDNPFVPYSRVGILVKGGYDRIVRFRHDNKEDIGVFIFNQKHLENIADELARGPRHAFPAVMFEMVEEITHHDAWRNAVNSHIPEPSEYDLEMEAHLAKLDAYAMRPLEDRFGARDHLAEDHHAEDKYLYEKRIYARLDSFLVGEGKPVLTGHDRDMFDRLHEHMIPALDLYIREVLAAESGDAQKHDEGGASSAAVAVKTRGRTRLIRLQPIVIGFSRGLSWLRDRIWNRTPQPHYPFGLNWLLSRTGRMAFASMLIGMLIGWSPSTQAPPANQKTFVHLPDQAKATPPSTDVQEAIAENTEPQDDLARMWSKIKPLFFTSRAEADARKQRRKEDAVDQKQSAVVNTPAPIENDPMTDKPPAPVSPTAPGLAVSDLAEVTQVFSSFRTGILVSELSAITLPPNAPPDAGAALENYRRVTDKLYEVYGLLSGMKPESKGRISSMDWKKLQQAFKELAALKRSLAFSLNASKAALQNALPDDSVIPGLFGDRELENALKALEGKLSASTRPLPPNGLFEAAAFFGLFASFKRGKQIAVIQERYLGGAA